MVFGLLFLVAAAPVDHGSPSGIVRSFYSMYVSLQHAKPRGLFEHLSDAKPYLTNDLYRSLVDVATTERCFHVEILDADPFTASQLSTNRFSLGPATIHRGRASVPVTVRLQRDGTSGVIATVVASQHDWRISDIVSRPQGSMAATLKSDLARLSAQMASATRSERSCALRHGFRIKP